jgi:hypothetical protein
MEAAAEHLDTVVAEIVPMVRDKYIAGQLEHGGVLINNPNLLDESINEAVDLLVYLVTERQRRRRRGNVHDDSDNRGSSKKQDG